jgi:hypothetical protein
MSEPGRPFPSVEFDTFGVALGLAVVAGGLALAAPFLNSLVVTLVALACAGWAAGRSRCGQGWADLLQLTRLAGVLLVMVGAGAFLGIPVVLSPERGLLLALSPIPLWFLERRGTLPRSLRRGTSA